MQAPLSPPPPPGWGIYVHAPWCKVRCPYCAFNVHPHRNADWTGWQTGVQRDAARWLPHFSGSPNSIYLGGGTPSLMPQNVLEALLSTLPQAPEVTLEANPGTVSQSHLDQWLEAGVTRLSLGIQTFNPRFARLLNRGHSVRYAQQLLAWTHAAGFQSWSLDLMFALPGQTTTDVEVELESVLQANPPHVSLYGLTFEEGTPFARAKEKLIPPDEDTWRTMLEVICATLKDHGWERYELSNFARPGHRSVHNQDVWRGGPYAGLGPGAHGLLPEGTRTIMTPDPSHWLTTGDAQQEAPSPHTQAVDLLLTQLRHIDGLDQRQLDGWDLDRDVLTDLTKHGLIEARGDHIRLTHAGTFVADGVTQQLVGALARHQISTNLPTPEPP